MRGPRQGEGGARAGEPDQLISSRDFRVPALTGAARTSALRCSLSPHSSEMAGSQCVVLQAHPDHSRIRQLSAPGAAPRTPDGRLCRRLGRNFVKD